MVGEVNEKVAKGLRIAGPVGTGDPLTVYSPWDGSEVATINTTRLDEVDLAICPPFTSGGRRKKAMA